MCEAFERAIVTHCAPTLAGHKCGSLFSWHGCPDSLRVEEADGVLSRKGVRVRLLRSCANGALVYVYRPEKLAARLKDNAVRAFLAGEGYADLTIASCLERLSERIVCGRDFPHEIGVFLDYPLEDVIGFIRHRGSEYRCLGCWKAYGDVAQAEKRFALYRKCQRVYLDCYRRGFGVLRLTVAA